MYFFKSTRTSKGFTLVEVSIVLVIIGLIVSSVVAGNVIVKQAKLRSVITDIDKFKVAINTFKLEYDALPGDMDRASQYWPTTCVDNAPNFCDGDGDKLIEIYPESHRSWQHLNLANIIAGSYRGNSVADNSIVGIDIPEAPFKNSGYSLHYHVQHPALLNVPAGTMILFGTETSGGTPNFPVITAKDAYVIDVKMDDGFPDSGIAHPRTHPSCHTGSAPNIVYKVDDPVISCALYFTLFEQ